MLPGIIDPHTHLGLAVPFGQELESETRSAILGGVTTIGTYFNQPGSYLPVIDRLRREVSQLSRVDMIPHFSLREQQQIDELPLYSRQGMNSFKVYMCGVPGLYPHQEDGFIIRLMQRMKQLPPTAHPILSIHCENTSICDYATEDMQSQPLDTLADWNRTHPNLAEGEAVRRAAYFAREMGVRTYVVHSSTREAMEALAADKHPNLYVETTSPYLCLDTDSPIGAYGKMLPPIREPESRKALWDGIRSGLIDTIGTDNTVLTAGEKQVSSGMREAGAGYPTLGTHLVSVLDEGIYRQELPIEKLVPLMTMNPARIFGVYPRKGTILPRAATRTWSWWTCGPARHRGPPPAAEPFGLLPVPGPHPAGLAGWPPSRVAISPPGTASLPTTSSGARCWSTDPPAEQKRKNVMEMTDISPKICQAISR